MKLNVSTLLSEDQKQKTIASERDELSKLLFELKGEQYLQQTKYAYRRQSNRGTANMFVQTLIPLLNF